VAEDHLISYACIYGLTLATVMQVVGVTSASSREELEQLLSSCHVISLHCPLNERTRGLIGDSELALMRREAILINCSRGDVIDKEALVRTLLVCSW